MSLTMEETASTIVDRLQEGKDLVVAATGNERDGKSSFCINLSLEIAKKAHVPFDVEKNILYSPNFADTKTAVKSLPWYSPIIADEAIKTLYKLKWQDKLQQYMNMLYNVCGKERKVSFICIPQFTDMNPYFRRHRVRMWAFVVDPISVNKPVGHAAIFMKSWNPVSDDPWNFKELDKLINEHSRLKKIKEVEFNLYEKIVVLSKSRNFVGILPFGQTPAELYPKYSELKDKYAYEGLDEDTPTGKVEARHIARLVKLIEYEVQRGLSMKEVGEIVGLTQARISKLLDEFKSDN